MILFLLLLLMLNYCKTDNYKWDTSILQVPPWGVDNCTPTTERCISETPIDCEQTCYNINNCTINVAIILTVDEFYIVNVNETNSTLHMAEEEIYKRGILSNNIRFQYQYYDDMCKQEYATVRVISASCADVIFGPACDYCLASVGRVAKYLWTPVITPTGFSFDFTNKKIECSDEFYMVINSGPADYRSFAEFFHLILKRYGWKKVALMYQKNERIELGGEHTCQLLMKSVMEELKNEPNIEHDDGDLELLGLNYSQYLQKNVGVSFGIILLCTSQKNLREIAIEFDRLNMVGSGEYTIFNFETYNDRKNCYRYDQDDRILCSFSQLIAKIPNFIWFDEIRMAEDSALNIWDKFHSATYPSEPWYVENDEENNEIAKRAFKSIFTFTPIHEARFDEIANSNRRRGYTYTDSLYDGMLLYANALNKTIGDVDMNFTGYEVIRNMIGTSFKGKDEHVVMNCNGQRAASYVMMHINTTGQYEIVAEYTNLNKTIVRWNVEWPNGVPKDTPVCGYDNSLCPKFNQVNILLISLIVVLCLGITIVGLISYRHFKLKAAIYSMAWKVDYDDIVFLNSKPRNSWQSLASRRGSKAFSDVDSVAGDRQLYATVAFYKSNRVAVKHLKDVHIDLTREQLIELKVMKDLSHDNLVKFYGACLDIPNCILVEYCQKGSLQDILENENYKLDWTFRMSLIMDIVRGMVYIHNSTISSHGALKSTNCLVDGRFVLKIADFGLHFIRKYAHDDDVDNNIEDHSYWERQLWTAPELLRLQNPPPQGTQKGDVYSFGIIMHEIICRQGVFYLDEYKNAKEKVDAVRKGPEANGGQPLRPSMGDMLCEEEVDQIMKKCWIEDAADRPDFTTLKSKLRHINKESDGNLLDNLLVRMEQYANNLETLVEERTADYLEEKRKCEELLYRLLPKSVAQQLITRDSVIAETFEYVTIHFSDIVSFTALSAVSTPLQVVEFLNDLYTCFDSIIENFDVYKVETIGDSYMVVSGLPVRNANRHAIEIARMSLALLKAVKTFKIRHLPDRPLQLRIGIHTGPCVAGVVGLKMPRYCLFGDTVNTASRMESNGLPQRIHISGATKDFLEKFGNFDIERRGEVELKGKGKMVTYWLNGENEIPPENLQASKANRRPSTPIPSSIRKQISTSAKLLNEISTEEEPREEADIPLLSVTSPPENNSNA